MLEDLLSQTSSHSTSFLELCNALYERELRMLAMQEQKNIVQVQARLKSLPYYIKRTAGKMLKTNSPILLDLQNASWAMKQSHSLPIKEQSQSVIRDWYTKHKVALGLIVPILIKEGALQRIVIDCVDKVDLANNRFRTNYCGWFNYQQKLMNKDTTFILLKPNKKVLSAACCGHQWHAELRTIPKTLSLRELLLSCEINWSNFKAVMPSTSSLS